MKLGWLKNSGGKPDALFSLAVLSWIVTVFCIVAPMFSGFEVPFTQYVMSVTPPDNTLVITFLGTCFTGYVVRRNAKLKVELEEKMQNDKNISGSF
jgi:hypothetical protein